jgi:dTDP-glucose 4,6-dehydratase
VTNIELTRTLLDLLGKPESLIEYVADRPGHDLRYAIDSSKAEQELGWRPEISFRDGIRQTIDWYLAHGDWVARIQNQEYLRYYEEQYGRRHGS